MPKILDKEQKRLDIALSAKELFLEKGFKNLSVEEVAKSANIAKGSIYNYFSNKEDIIFEILSILIAEHNIKKKEMLSSAVGIEDRICVFFEFFYNPQFEELRKIYKECIYISISSANIDLLKFNTLNSQAYRKWFEDIIKQGIDNNELKPSALDFSEGIFCAAEGMFLHSCVSDYDNVEVDFKKFVKSIVNIIKVEL